MGATMPNFTSWLNNTIIYKKWKSQDGAGDIVYASDGVTLSCYISGNHTLVVNDKGEEIVSAQQIYLDGSNTTVAEIALVDFKGIVEISSRNRPIKTIEKFYDEDGLLDLVVLYL